MLSEMEEGCAPIKQTFRGIRKTLMLSPIELWTNHSLLSFVPVLYLIQILPGTA
jgi:hypothetical protein